MNLSHLNPYISKVNEIKLAYYLVNNDKSKIDNLKTTRKYYNNSVSKLNSNIVREQSNKAKKMAKLILNFSNKDIRKVWWTGIPGILSKNNPADVLIQFHDNSLLGISIKSSYNKKNKIVIKNQGLGTISKALDLDLERKYRRYKTNIVNKLCLPEMARQRKKFIRKNKIVQLKTMKYGNKILTILRNDLLLSYQDMNQIALKKHVRRFWLKSMGIKPKYIKILSSGSGKDIETYIEKSNQFSKKIGKLKIISIGSNSIGIMNNDDRFLLLRFKFASEKLGSSIKINCAYWS